MDTQTNLPECWQEFYDVLSAGIDRVILFGPPGTGKTFAGLTAGNVTAGAHRLICTEDMTQADVTGCFMPNAQGTWNWQVGAAIKAGNGKAMVKTVNGAELTFAESADGITITDAKGHVAKVTIADVNQSNGVIHVIDTVLLP